MSSTAIAAKQLADQGELTSRHGRMAVAVLMFQDIATVPLLTLLSVLGSNEETHPAAIGAEILRVANLLAVTTLLAKPVFHRMLAGIARHQSGEVFLLAGVLLVLAAGYGAHVLGVSPALGAFLAGLVLGESDFRHRMEHDIRPFRDLLLGIFFITIGLQLDAGSLVRQPWTVLLWLLALVPVKTLLAWPALRLSGCSRLDAWRAALILGHGGEFTLLVIASAMSLGLVASALGQPVLVAVVLSMALAPLVIAHHDYLAQALARHRGTPPPQEEETLIEAKSAGMRDHVIILGAGQLGRLVAEMLARADIPHLLVEFNYEAYVAARAAELPVLYGEAARIATLRAAGAARARMVIITFHRVEPALKIARALRHEYPHLAIIATALAPQEARRLARVPGVRVYEEKLAAGLALAEQALLESGVSAEDADRLIATYRSNLLRLPPA